MTLAEIFARYTAGSPGFCIAAETHFGADLSRAEIERIGRKAWDCSASVRRVGGYHGDDRAGFAAGAFHRIWERERWWRDDEQEEDA